MLTDLLFKQIKLTKLALKDLKILPLKCLQQQVLKFPPFVMRQSV